MENRLRAPPKVSRVTDLGMDSAFDLSRFRLPPSNAVVASQSRKLPLPKKKDLFLKGPVSMPWLRAAARLPGKALCVGVELWFQVGLTRSTEVALNLSRFKQNGISRSAASRGLAAMEKGGLVSVVRHPGRKPIVHVLEAGGAEVQGSSDSPGAIQKDVR